LRKNILGEIIGVANTIMAVLAGAEVIFKLKKQIKKMQREINKVFDQTQQHLDQQTAESQETIQRNVNELSGGELQKVAIASCLSRKTGIYLIDEPSAYLDVEERLAMARTIRRAVEDRGATAFVVEHDVSTLDFIADRVMVFDGLPG
jgi:translation initiation factor RLI1